MLSRETLLLTVTSDGMESMRVRIGWAHTLHRGRLGVATEMDFFCRSTASTAQRSTLLAHLTYGGSAMQEGGSGMYKAKS